jgi:hypothetical protein
MKKKSFFIMFLIFGTMSIASYAQVKDGKWPKATVNYFEEPRVLVAAHFTPVVGIPYTGLFYGVDANVKLAKLLYVSGGFMLPILDLSFVDGGPSNYSFYGGGELVLRRKRESDRFDLTISSSQTGNVITTKYRDYYVDVYESRILRFGAEYFANSRYSPNFMNTKQGFKFEPNIGLKMPDGTYYTDHSFTFNCLFFYIGIGKKSLNYFTIKMSDYQESDKFTTTLTGYFDLFYAPFLSFTPFTYRNASYNPADYYLVMPFGGRLGFEAYRTMGKYLGFYTRVEFGMMPGVGYPAFVKWGVGVSSIVKKLKSIGNELK